MSTDSLHPLRGYLLAAIRHILAFAANQPFERLALCIPVETRRRTGEAKGDPPAYGRTSRMGPSLPVTRSTGGTVEQLARFRPDALFQFVHDPRRPCCRIGLITRERLKMYKCILLA